MNVLAAAAEPRLIAPPLSVVVAPDIAKPRTVIPLPVSDSAVPAAVEPRSVAPLVLTVIAVSALTAPVAVSVSAWMRVAPCDTETTLSGAPGACGAVKFTAPLAWIVVVVPVATVLPELALPVTVTDPAPSVSLEPVVTLPSRIAPLPAVAVKSVATLVWPPIVTALAAIVAEPVVVVSEGTSLGVVRKGAVNEAALFTLAPVTKIDRATLIAPVVIAPSARSRASCPLPATVIACVAIAPLPALMDNVDGPFITSGSAITPLPTVIGPLAENPVRLVADRLAPLTVPRSIAPAPVDATIADSRAAVPPDKMLLPRPMPVAALKVRASVPTPSLLAVSVSAPAPWPIEPPVEVTRTAPLADWLVVKDPPSTTFPAALTV